MNPLPGVDSDTPVELRRQPGTWDNRLIEKRQKVLTESGADPPAKHHFLGTVPLLLRLCS